MSNSIIEKKLKDEKYLKVFLIGFLSFLAVILPIIIFTGGYYIYYGDYNSQQIPFYTHSHEFVRSEGLGWDWGTDLGSNFIGSYSFYLLGSPFFWLTLPFPNAVVVFLMPLLLALKHGVAALTAYAYIRRFVRRKPAAMIGALLYAFSGFQLFNIFFNHFQDVTALFPLMLIALEENVNNKRRGYFAVTVAVMGILNYFFFAGQAVFIIIYIITRLGSPDFKITWKKFLFVAIEAIIGVMIAMVLLLPAALSILGNYRINERLYGLDLVTYSDKTRIPRIIESFFMLPDVPARPNLFSSDGAKWSSIGGYLPMFSMAGVIAFAKSRRKHWSVKLVIVCMICAFIPILNSMFYTFNSSYYARWFYMPILIMAMMSAQAFDDRKVDFRPAIQICAVVLAAFGVISLMPSQNDDGEVKWFELAAYPEYFYLTLGISAAALVLLWYIDKKRRKGQKYLKTGLYSTVICCIACTITVVYFGVTLGTYPSTYIGNGIYGSSNIDIDDPKEQFFRIDISENFDNYPMFWGLPCMRAFQSTVSPSIMEFYEKIGVTRDVASRAPLDKYTIRGLFSTKYYFDRIYTDDKEEYKYDIGLPGFEYTGEQNNFYVYENKSYIPMGFAYDYSISEKESKNHSESVRERVLLRALELSDEDAEKYKDILKPVTQEQLMGLNKTTYLEDCEDRRNESCYDFKYDSEGFDAKIDLEEDKAVFFSVPYDKGWSAYVNGEKTDIIKANYGFMAVKANKGKNEIHFEYDTPGLKYGAVVSLAGILILAVYILIMRKKRVKEPVSHYYDYDKEYSCQAEKIYLNSFDTKE